MCMICIKKYHRKNANLLVPDDLNAADKETVERICHNVLRKGLEFSV